MTIHTYYYTYGFLVPIDDCIALLGYTYDKLNENIRKEIIFEQGFDEDEVKEFSEQRWMREWYEMDSRSWENNTKTFVLDGVKFVVRSFVHSREEHGLYYVVGIDHGKMDRFYGGYEQNAPQEGDPTILLAKLVQNKAWYNAISKKKSTLVAFQEEKFYVKSSDDRDWIIPEIHMTTDDCDCCS